MAKSKPLAGVNDLDLPFAASFEALCHIVGIVRQACSHPKTGELVPTLCVAESPPYGDVFVGCYQPQDIPDAVQVHVLGRRVFVLPETLERLAGKQLVLKTVDSGTPEARQMLTAVVRQGQTAD